MDKAIFVLNGPNLNLLGTREPEIYGTDTLADIETACQAVAERLGVPLIFRQTNHEGELVDWLQEARTAAAGVLLNAGALTHTSVALYDAIKAMAIPVLEIHLSNPLRREAFRHQSYIGMAAHGTIAGFGLRSYVLGMEALAPLIQVRS
ncbi:3-dehydroquinate dehydratase [Candidatus Phycosocius bacilliformis]|uniref:3-dehydroquinate dehydratase n=1 Tax=Candidatus Phycosocius bacilliformis TaxID=1445552 RepID=A0A2P2E8A6_9PROT|nr:type II 3-dehydroquinate dehydratase [Candidatus Phycosocius bacilliformis]GBF57306.1 3-dehydroquinate dehydratase [Candidatus Phycosocius bacilliformis]